MRAIGVDVGGSKVAVGVLADPVTPRSPGQLVDVVDVALPTKDYDALLGFVADAARRLEAAHGPAPAIGVAMAAWLSPDRERVLTAANLGWGERALRRDLETATARPVVVHNDGNCAAWAEFRLAGPDQPDGPGELDGPGGLVMLTLGTDVGGGVVVDGRLVTGASGVAGELGHLTVRPDGPPCVCGSHGCLAVYASGTAMLTAYRSAGGTGADPDHPPTGADLSAAARRGDPAAVAAVTRAGEAIALASGQISRVIDHDVLVLGGGGSELGRLLLDVVEAHLATAEPVGPIRPHPVVRLARAGRHAGVLGAADLAAAELDTRTERS